MSNLPKIDQLLIDHDWTPDHMRTSKENIEEVFNS